MALEFDRSLCSSAAETPVKPQSYPPTLTTNLVTLSLDKIGENLISIMPVDMLAVGGEMRTDLSQHYACRNASSEGVMLTNLSQHHACRYASSVGMMLTVSFMPGQVGLNI